MTSNPMARTPSPETKTTRQRIVGAALAAVVLVSAAACSDEAVASDELPETSEQASAASSDSADSNDGQRWLFDSSIVHEIDIEFDEVAYDAMIATYEIDGEKDWIEATVTIDGTTIDSVGLRLKGNSSLFGLTSATAQNPEDLPWLLRFDKFVDDQLYQDHADLVIRSNSTETAINEAVALELLGLTGLATEEAVAARLTVNGGETELRLAMELPDDDVWVETSFSSEASLLYKADSTGDYSYRGEDPDAYDDVFDQKYGEDDLAPLIDFLDFINNVDDETFADELGDRLDVEAFATYLAYQDVIGNGDDIDGRGNNSYLHFDGDTAMFTVVNWDLNLAFNTANVNGGNRAGLAPGADPAAAGNAAAAGRPQGGGGGRPQPQGDAAGGPGAAGVGGNGAGGSNVLAARFLATPAFAELYETASAELVTELFDSGAADDIIDTWVATLREGASDLVDASTVDSDADALRSWIERS